MSSHLSSCPLGIPGAVNGLVGAQPRVQGAGAIRRIKVAVLIVVLLPLLAFAAAVSLSWSVAFDWVHLGIMGFMCVVSGLGITVGYHRLCTHGSFQTPGPVRYLLAAAGSMAVQGPVISWCGDHRRHHQHSDSEGDPHSPHMHEGGSWGEGLWATVRGAFHAHVGWLLLDRGERTTDARYTADLRRDPWLVMADRHFLLWVILGLVIPALLGGVLTQTWWGALMGLLWGGLTRVLLVHHVTWSVNSICHLWGSRPYQSHDESRNNAVVGVLALGEGWHNNHHAFPTSARHGLEWWQLDVSYLLIRAMALVGLARKIRRPDAQRKAMKSRRDA
jgi:stearoyl-CoA desaturase (delta-9 desaturase)